MANFYSDNPDIQFNLERLDLPALADLLEEDYSDADKFDFAPIDSSDAVENYFLVCNLAGEVCGTTITRRARQIDREGNVCADGDVIYHPLVKENLRDFKQAQLMGISLPRKSGGLNMPQVVKAVVLEMVSRADASLMNLVGLQDIAETIIEFGTEEQKAEFVPTLASGDGTGAMVLTEPDAGSDLQAVRLKAVPPESGDDSGTWQLNGVKRFITNGNGDILLVQARSEEGTSDARGISLFVCHKDKTIQIRRIEEKLGIHGSPTCEMTFNNTPAYLIGKRKFGLIKYVMALMNGARLGIAAQALGITEAIYREAREYAETRIQFNKPIIDIPAVYEMLVKMKVNIEAGRLLVYNTAKVVDLYKIPQRQIEAAKQAGQPVDQELRRQAKYNERLASVLTPFAKYFLSEMSNREAYNGIQIMGGSGFMKDYDMERFYRDARITSIYEGTSQLQVVAAIGGLMSGALRPIFEEFINRDFPEQLSDRANQIKSLIPQLQEVVNHVRELKNSELSDLTAKRIVDMGIDFYISTLFLDAACDSEAKHNSTRIWIEEASLRIETNYRAIMNNNFTIFNLHKQILGDDQVTSC
ncbi:MAG: acyl-CoA dehydrogenase family protein [Candidatus Marinimicrobia bacterium]|nr:acyl-CoA dehydrogenase family protein [Candidatus Neomarinimicrobiota bacterium]